LIKALNIRRVPTFPPGQDLRVAKILYRDISAGYKKARQLETEGKIATERSRFGADDCPVRKEMLQKMGVGSDFCPDSVIDEAKSDIHYKLSYRTVLEGRKVLICFYLKEDDLSLYDGVGSTHMEAILVALYVLMSYSARTCPRSVEVNFIMTDAKKILPDSELDVIGPVNMNSGFATRCGGDIVIYRKEEWFKLLIHEGFHYFGLDSLMDNEALNRRMQALFRVDSNINIPEAYTETWARILNCCIAGFYHMKGKRSFDHFNQLSTLFLELERTFSCYQMVKVLSLMGISYKDLYSDGDVHELRRSQYRENTNVFAYIVIGGILMNNYTGFMHWCDVNNSSLLRFTNRSRLDSFYDLVVSSSKTELLLEMVHLIEGRLGRRARRKRGGSSSVLRNTGRMSLVALAHPLR